MRQKKRFTPVELLVVVLMLGAIATLAAPHIMGGAQDTRINTCKTNIDLINSQIELYYANEGSWPAVWEDVAGTADAPTEYFPDGPPVCPFGTAYAYNTTTHRVAEHSH